MRLNPCTICGFGIFRDDALRRFQTAFDLAARHTYLAAKAYDYETGLLYSDRTGSAGSKFLEDVVRARAPGRFYIWLGTPMVGRPHGRTGPGRYPGAYESRLGRGQGPVRFQ